MRNAPPPSKRKIRTIHEEKISFDPAARQEYLTGFHKRKLERRKHAETENAKREKEEKMRFRRELREQRKTDLVAHVAETNRLMRLANGDIPALEDEDSEDSSANGDDDADADTPFDGFSPINEEEEYIDPDKHTTVTVESVGITRSGFLLPGDAAAEAAAAAAATAEREAAEKKKRVWTKERPRSERPKKKKVKFRYETKAERKVERMKQGAKKKKLAEKRSKAKEEGGK